MDSFARDSYLEAQVTTATPQRMRLLLIEAANRFCKQTLRFWQEEKNEEALESLIRARSIISELLSSIQSDKTELTQKVAGVYVFLFSTVTQAQFQRNPKAIEEVIEVLGVERETWRLVCEKLPHAPVPAESTVREITAAEAEQTLAKSAPLTDSKLEDTSLGGLVLDA
ncbi:MAG: flagellar export chaperone FliS [Pirellulaceae bacterium]